MRAKNHDGREKKTSLIGRSELPIPMEVDCSAEWKLASPQHTQDNNNKETNPINKTRADKFDTTILDNVLFSEGKKLLLSVGVDNRVAIGLAEQNSYARIYEVVEYARQAGRNPPGMVRSALEGNWSFPAILTDEIREKLAKEILSNREQGNARLPTHPANILKKEPGMSSWAMVYDRNKNELNTPLGNVIKRPPMRSQKK